MKTQQRMQQRDRAVRKAEGCLRNCKNEDITPEGIGRDGCDASQREFLRQPVLEGMEGPLRTPAGRRE
jgi:hypothetical protein